VGVDIQLVSNIVAIVVGLVVGGRLLYKGLRTGAVPEIALGAGLALDGFEWLCWFIALYTPVAETSLADVFFMGSRIGITLAVSCIVYFTRVVFRPDSTVASAAGWLIIGTQIAVYPLSAMVGDSLGLDGSNPWLQLELVVQAAAYVWIFAESFSYYIKMRRRVGHGLADPLVVNSFALWSMYSAASFLSQSVYMLSYLFDDGQGHYPYIFDAVMALLAAGGSSAVWLAFFPPRAYANWARSGSSTSAA